MNSAEEIRNKNTRGEGGQVIRTRRAADENEELDMEGEVEVEGEVEEKLSTHDITSVRHVLLQNTYLYMCWA